MARALSRKQIERLKKKVESGDVLSDAERAAIAQIDPSHEPSDGDTGEMAKSWRDLADRLGISRRSLQDWRKKYAGDCPPTLSVPEWVEFSRSISSKAGPGADAKRLEDLGKAELEAEKLREAIEALRIRNARDRGELISVPEIASSMREAAESAKKELLKMEDSLPVRLVSKSTEEIRIIIRAEIDAICASIAGRFKEMGEQ